MKKSAALLALLLTTVAAAPAFADEPIIAIPIKAELPFKELSATRDLPGAITVNGQSPNFDQAALLQGESLLVPLRFIVEAADGQVEWDPATQSVTVTLPDRTATFVIGQSEAELNEKGVYYFQRNMIQLAQPVSIQNGRTMISADALTTVLGLVERVDQDENLDLITLPKLVEEGEASIQIVPNAIEKGEAPAALQEWAVAQRNAEAASYSVAQGANGRYLAISGGLQPTGGYTIEIVSTKLVDGLWQIQAQVLPPDGPATQALTNPVAYFELSGMDGEIDVQVLGAPSQAETR